MSRSARGPLRPWMVISAVSVAVLVAAAFNVKVVSLEEASSAAAEGQLDAATYAAENYDEIAAYVDDEAQDLATLLADLAGGADEAEFGNTSGASSAYAFPVTFTATAGDVTPPTLPVTVEGVPAETTVVVQVGPALNGTALRDVSGLVSFNSFTNQLEYQEVGTELSTSSRTIVFSSVPTSWYSFTNQLEYQEVGTELNTIVRDDVLAGFDAAAAAGRPIQVTGAFLRVNPQLVSVVPTAIEVVG